MKLTTLAKWQLLVVLGLLGLLLLGGIGSASASDIRSGDTVTIAAGEVIDDDLIVFGNTVVMNGTVNGDLVAFGNTITVNGTVNGSAMLAGQTLLVGGTVKGTLYGGGSTLTLAPLARIERNMFFGGYNLETRSESVIARDLVFGGSQAVLGGSVGRDAKLAGQALELNGRVAGNVRAEVGEPQVIPMNFFAGANLPPAIPSGLRVSKNAEIGGQLLYASTVEQAGAILAQPRGGVVYSQQIRATSNAPAPSPYEWLFTRLRDFFTVLILGALALWIAPRYVNQAVTHARDKTLAATGWGLVVLVVGYALVAVAGIVLMIVGIVIATTTLGGLAAATFGIGAGATALLFTVFTAVVLWGSKVIIACLIGKLLFQAVAKQYADNLLAAFVVGLVLFEIVAAIPFLGTIVTIVAVLLGLGAIWYVYYDRRRTHPLPIPTTAPAPA